MKRMGMVACKCVRVRVYGFCSVWWVPLHALPSPFVARYRRFLAPCPLPAFTHGWLARKKRAKSPNFYAALGSEEGCSPSQAFFVPDPANS